MAIEPEATVPAGGALDGVWYGGVSLRTVESRSDGTRAGATQGKVLSDRPSGVPRPRHPDSTRCPDLPRGASAPSPALRRTISRRPGLEPHLAKARKTCQYEAYPQQGGAVSAFWDTWRKEIIRGSALFCAVLAIVFSCTMPRDVCVTV